MILINKSNHREIKTVLRVRHEAILSMLKPLLTHEEFNLFAYPDVRTEETHWFTNFVEQSTPNYRIASLTTLSEEEQVRVRSKMSSLINGIIKKIENHEQLKNIINDLFLVPDENQIHAVFIDDRIHIVLAQWGYVKHQRSSAIDIVKVYIEPEQNNRGPVILHLNYLDGSPAVEEFFYQYHDFERSLELDEKGSVDLGDFKHGEQIKVFKNFETNAFETFVTVEPGQTDYHITVPYWTNVEIQVLNQFDEPAINHPILISYMGGEQHQNSDAAGRIKLEQVLFSNEDFHLLDETNNAHTANYKLNRLHNHFTFKLALHVQETVGVCVVNGEEPIADYPVLINDKAYHSDTNGSVYLHDLSAGDEVQVVDGKNEYNKKAYQVNHGANQFVFPVTIEKRKDITVKLIDNKNQALKAYKVDAHIGENQIKEQTNDEGSITYAHGLFENVKKFKVELDSPYNAKKRISKKVKFNPEQTEYILKIKKRRFPWWLILLLLPLLLFVKCEKTIKVLAVDHQNKPIVGAGVQLDYASVYLYDEGEFNKKSQYSLNGVTDKDGIVEFKKVKYSVYSLISMNSTIAKIQVNSDCYHCDILKKKFHYISLFYTETLKMKCSPKYMTTEFLIIDSETKDPINKAKFTFIQKMQSDSLQHSESEPDGLAVVRLIPCANMTDIIVRANGYQDFILDSLSCGKALMDIENRTIEMVAERDAIEFYIIDCETKEPIPNVAVSIITQSPSGKNVQKSYTNIDGNGRGSVKDIRVIDKISFEIEHSGYDKAIIEPNITVEEFNKLPKERRTFCLQPMPIPVEIKVVDALNSKPIAGAKVFFERNRNGKITIDTLYTNKNGITQLNGLIVGDEITLIVTKDPLYNEKREFTKLKVTQDFLERPKPKVVKLDPKELEIVIQVIDADNKSIIHDADLKLTSSYYGLHQSINTGKKNEVKLIVKAPDIITISASKNGYKTNNYTIKTKSAVDVNRMHQPVQIPLDLPPCSGGGASEKAGDYSLIEYDLSKSAGTIIFRYNTDNIPDEFRVYCGRKADKSPSNLLFEYANGKTTGQNTYEERIQYSGCRFVTVEAKSTDPGNSVFWYEIICP